MLPTLKQHNLFEYNLSALWLKPPKCAVCCNDCCIKSKNPRRPLLMKCSHTVCDRCCLGHRPTLLTCNQCNQITRIERQVAIRECLETNYYLMGILSYKEYNLEYDLNFVNTRSPIDKRAEREKTLQECSECVDVLTNSFCIQCSVPYCKNCFDLIHKRGKVLQKHCLSHFDHRGKPSIEFDDNKCRRHNNFINKYCVDCKIAMCQVCVMDGHTRHKISSLVDENQKSMSQIPSLIEAVKSAKDSNRQAQKDAKFIIKRYEDSALETIQDISQYFIYLHGVLQSIEREALFKVKENTLQLILKVQHTQSALKRGQETFEEIQSTLEQTLSHPPANFTISKLVEKTNSILEGIPCNIQFDGVSNNPFEFIKMKKEPVDFPNLYELHAQTTDFRPRILTYFGDMSSIEHSKDSSSNRSYSGPSKIQQRTAPPPPLVHPASHHSLSQQSKKKFRKPRKNNSVSLTQVKPPPPPYRHCTEGSLHNLSNSSFTLKNSTTQKVHVSHIKNPENFYVQIQEFLTVLPELNNRIMEEVEFAPTPDYIDVGEVYLLFNAANQTWYRGRVLNNSSQDMFKVFLIDFGNSIQVPKQRFRVISETLKSKPNGAVQCSLYGIKCIKNEWNDNANQLMSEIIMNEMVHLILYKEDTICQVDLVTTHLTYRTSVRNALIFANFAIDDINLPVDMQKRVQQLSGVRKSLLTPPNEKFYKNVFKEGESFRGIILNVTDPHNFYAIKYDHKGVLDNIYEELNQDYQQPQQKLFTPLVNMPCAVYIEDKWHRAKITKIDSKSCCTVWLVDRAQSHTLPYTQIRALQAKYLTMNECAFQCSLTDIEPHQKYGYMWTPTAVQEFKRIIQNPVLQIIVHRTQNFLHQICLYIIKKDLDVNVNALLVKYKHANSTGAESQYVEYPKLTEVGKCDDDILNEINLMEMTLNENKKATANVRAKVKILHIVSPGEFYLTKLENQAAIARFQEEIQSSRNKDEQVAAKPYENASDNESENESQWKVGNCCLARLRAKDDGPIQWHRAVIREIELPGIENVAKYTVFLRDQGTVFRNIAMENIAPIPAVFSRVCDGAIKCHMACLQPTGGLTVWSGSSIDEFKSAVNKFHDLSASIQGIRENDSIPIVLWGLRQECPDPLAPTIFKWININKYLSASGLAHLTEKFHAISETNAFKNVPKAGEETLNEWLDHLNRTVDRTLKDDVQITILQREEEFEISEEEAHIDSEDGAEFTTWLPARLVTKTVFLGIPTFVDNEGVIYLYDAEKKQVFDNIITVVNKVVKKTKESNTDSFWYIGQPCLAQYNVDSKFYRAIVLETKPDRRVNVQFVDYGNVQECSTKDLRKQVTLTKIPIQVTKYKLDGIIPPEGKTKFTLDAFDFLYANIVNKQCAIRVSPNQQNEEIKLITMKCGPVDIIELFVEAGFGRKSRPSSRNSFLDVILSPANRVSQKKRQNKIETKDSTVLTSKIFSPKNKIADVKSDDDDDVVIEAIVEEHASSSKHDIEIKEAVSHDYQELFEKIELDKLHTIERDSSDLDSDEEFHNIERTYKPGCCSADPLKNLESNDDEADEEAVALIDKAAVDTSLSSIDMKNTSTSTRMTRAKQTSFEPFLLMSLPKSVKKFHCEVSFILDCITIAIYPFIPDHKKLILELTKDIQIAAALSPNIKTYEPNTPCLAMFSEDKMWYRAMIRSYNPDDNLADVVFVDFFNTEWVPAKKVRICPSDLIKIPLRNLPVKLSGIVPNHRWRSVDIQRKFAEYVEERQVYVKVVDYEGDMPVVELYEDEDSEELLYEPLITERFYLKI